MKKCSLCNLPGHNKRTCAEISKKTPDNTDALFTKDDCFKAGVKANRLAMMSQIGLKGVLSTSMLKDHWLDESGNYYDAPFEIVDVPTDDSDYVAVGMCSQGYMIDFSATMLTHVLCKIKFNEPDESLWERYMKELEGEKHVNSMLRASEWVLEYLNVKDPDPMDILLMLDGNGENRLGCIKALKNAKIPRAKWPRIINMDDDALTVLWTRIMFPEYVDDIRFTQADPLFRTKSQAKLSVVNVGIEHHITLQGSLTADDKRSVVGLYLDYPGGPPRNQEPAMCRQNFEKNIWPHLPNLSVYAVTISYRKHIGLNEYGTTHFIPSPDGFHLCKTFTANKLVRCDLFTKRALASDDGALFATDSEYLTDEGPSDATDYDAGHTSKWDETTEQNVTKKQKNATVNKLPSVTPDEAAHNSGEMDNDKDDLSVDAVNVLTNLQEVKSVSLSKLKRTALFLELPNYGTKGDLIERIRLRVEMVQRLKRKLDEC